MTADKDTALVLAEMVGLVAKVGAPRATQIFDCLNAIHEATKDFPDDIKQEAVQWAFEIARKS